MAVDGLLAELPKALFQRQSSSESPRFDPHIDPSKKTHRTGQPVETQ